MSSHSLHSEEVGEVPKIVTLKSGANGVNEISKMSRPIASDNKIINIDHDIDRMIGVISCE